MPVPVFTWTGFYVGVNAGYGWNNSDDNNCLGCFGTGALFVDTAPGVVAPVTAAPFSAIPATGGFGGNGDRDGFVGGAQVGFNYQFTPGSGFVVGVEADIQWKGGNDGNKNNGFFGGNGGLFAANPVAPFLTPGFGIVAVPPTGANVALFNRGGFGGSDNDWFGTARVRVGYAFDRVLVYATGGIAFTDGGSKNNGFFGFGNGGLFAANPVAPFLTPGFGIVGVPATGSNVALFNNGGSGLGSNSNDWFATARVRVGYAFDRVLVYATGGIAFTDDSGNNRGFGGFNSGPSFRRRSTSAPGRP